MPTRPQTAWWIHGLTSLCAVLILGAMAVLTRNVIRGEELRAAMEMQARQTERTRLALWRMDAAAAAWISDEAQRPVPGPAANESAKPEVKLRFDAREDGIIAADNPDRIPAFRLAFGWQNNADGYRILRGGLPEIPLSWNSPPPAPALSAADAAPAAMAEAAPTEAKYKATPAKKDSERKKQTFPLAKAEIADNELQNRGRALKQQVDAAQSGYTTNLANNGVTGIGDWSLVRAGLPRPARIGGELLLLRNLQWKHPSGALKKSIQGTWIDEPALQTILLREIADLFPEARLLAVPENSGDPQSLASFPWKLAVPKAADVGFTLPRSIVITLAAGWCAAVSAIAAAWTLVIGLLRLSERRASFVSAVTHELRTPLTTFQLYSDMLAEGTVKEEKRPAYFQTLRAEARRLSHLVENVLAFSRIERGSARAAPAVLAARDLLAPMLDRFSARLAEVGMVLRFDDSPAWQTMVRADPAATEHILFNLIDNAAKYAARGTVVLTAQETDDRHLAIRLADEGPGIPPSERRKIFRPFHKSAATAAETKPGVGLGLSLSRRLARASRGDLTCEGNAFVLILPMG